MHFARLIITPFTASRKLFVDGPGALLLMLNEDIVNVRVTEVKITQNLVETVGTSVSHSLIRMTFEIRTCRMVIAIEMSSSATGT